MNSNARSKLITISTDDVIPTGDGSYNVNVSKLSIETVKAISLRTATLRNIFYNVVSLGARKNNEFYFLLDGIELVITVPAGFYNITQLLSALSIQLISIFAASGIVPLPTLDELKYNSIQNKVEIIVNGNGSATAFELSGEVAGVQSINYLLGNWDNVTLDTLTPTPYQFLNQVNLAGLDNVQLISQDLASSNGFNSNSGEKFPNGRTSDLVAIIPLNAPFGGLVTYRSRDIDSEAIVSSLPHDFTTLRFALTDSKGNYLYLDNSSLTLEFIAFLE